ncbi:MAG TPA: bi-domain-containing oxidoreductase [Patescibacteria group bacterium]|nr:bi-domain-containing oxidoreductase [Patescibacteria group bacterium]
MLQVIQYQKTGEMYVEDLPAPRLKSGGVLIQSVASLISAGTERSSVETAQASMIGKAKSRPDLVKQVIDAAKRDGVMATYEKVKTRLDNYKELGYSSAGIVLESSVPEFKPGDRVACGGAGANHVEMSFVPKNLSVKIPENVSFEEAAFGTVGAIAMQGVRQADLRLGEYVAVIGLGLLGLITVQLLKANGCRVIGLDINENNFEIAKKLGCDICAVSNFDSIKTVESFTKGYGTDAVLITAATKSNEPLELSLQYARKKSKIVIVGAVNMNIPRSPFYEKELDFTISCSYGPGRYDTNYEEGGQDYPIGYVRWTERRNIEAILELIADGRLDVKSLITHRFDIAEALKAYDLITGKIQEKYLGVLITYPQRSEAERKKYKVNLKTNNVSKSSALNVGFIGAGNFAQSNLLPPLVKAGVALKGVVTSKPVNASSVGKKFKFEFCATDAAEVFKNNSINTVFIATRHDSHARYVGEALKAGKHVFVEKPLAINEEQLAEITEVFKNHSDQALLVGFNRRFSKPFVDMKEFFKNRQEPFVITYRVNAGFIPKSSWIQEPSQGGRIIGEGCHFIDCMQFLTEARPVSVYATAIESANSQVENYDSVNIAITYDDGSVGNLLYLANGDNSLEKEYCEAFCGGKAAIMNNFKELHLHSGGKKHKKTYSGGKGHAEEVLHFVNLASGKEKANISFESLYDTTLLTFKALVSLKTKQVVSL